MSIGITLALLAAVGYGAADFVGAGALACVVVVTRPPAPSAGGR